MFDSIYGLDVVSKYEGRILGTLPPHIFAMGAAAYNRLVTKNGENQVITLFWSFVVNWYSQQKKISSIDISFKFSIYFRCF